VATSPEGWPLVAAVGPVKATGALHTRPREGRRGNGTRQVVDRPRGAV